MKLTVFRRNAHTKEGKLFTVFVSQLTKKDGTTQYVTVKTGKSCPALDETKTPYIIEVAKEDAHLSRRKYISAKTGEEAYSYTLWVNAYKESTEKYVDHSLDEFE